MSPLSFDNGWRIVALTPPMKNNPRLKFGKLRSRDVAMATNFMVQDGVKLAFPAVIVCAGISKRLGRSQKFYP